MILTRKETRDLIRGREVRKGFVASVSVAIKTQVCESFTGAVVKDNPWHKNLVLDQGLNALARDNTASLRCGPSSAMRVCRIGDSTTPTKIASGAITFTQSTNQLTASSGFFTAAMVGGIFKYGIGTAGAEYYITAFTSATLVTVDTSATVGTPTVGTVWQVQQTTLQNLLYTTSTYQTLAGDNSSIITANTVTHQRTFIFPTQVSAYVVNEVGYNSISSGTAVLGRIVLPSTDSVGTTNFYRVIIQLTVTYTPATPSAVANIGVNWDTAGNAAIEGHSWLGIAASGADSIYQMGGLDGGGEYSGASFASTTFYLIARIGSTYTQNAAIAATLTLSYGTVNVNFLSVTGSNSGSWQKVTGRGKMELAFTGNITTTGQTCYGIGFSPNFASDNSFQNLPVFDVKFTTPQALPNGAWLPSIKFQLTYGRTLTN